MNIILLLTVLMTSLHGTMSFHHFEQECQKKHIEQADVNNCILTSEANINLRILKREITVSKLYPGVYKKLPIEHCDLSACIPGSDQECNFVCPDDPYNDIIMAPGSPSVTESTTPAATYRNYTSVPSATQPTHNETNQKAHEQYKRDTVHHRDSVKREAVHKSEIEQRYLWTCDFPNSGCCKSCRRLAPMFRRIKSGKGWVYPVFCIREGGYQLTEQVACLTNGCTMECEKKKVVTKLLVTNEPPRGWEGHCDRKSLPVWFKSLEMDYYCSCPPGGNRWSAPDID